MFCFLFSFLTLVYWIQIYFIFYSIKRVLILQFQIWVFSEFLIYIVKEMEFSENSSQEDDDEFEHCFGQIEEKKTNQKKPHSDYNSSDTGRYDSHDYPGPHRLIWFEKYFWIAF